MTAAALAGKSGRPYPIPSARYGSVELKLAAGRDMALGVGISAALNTLAMLFVAWFVASHGLVVPRTPEIVIICRLPALPHQDAGNFTPPPAGTTPQSTGVVTPVPDLASASLIFAPDVPEVFSLALPGENGPATNRVGGPGTVGQAPSGSDPGAPGTFIYREVEPALITMARPQYPDMARGAGIEGKVVVWMLVGKDGRVEQALVKRGVPLLNESALEAAHRWIFHPALSGGHPVAVWVEETFNFQIR